MEKKRGLNKGLVTDRGGNSVTVIDKEYHIGVPSSNYDQGCLHSYEKNAFEMVLK